MFIREFLRVADLVFLPGSGSGFKVSPDLDPVAVADNLKNSEALKF